MLKCNEIANLASDYLDKNLSWKEYFSVKMHLFMCGHCKRFVQHLLSTIRVVQGMERQLATTGETENIVACLPDKNQT
ncbi:MAG: zf-HC2 domain-containing protein [Gammaproteobacteria bacterium]|nr:zf-HC2 domain-containing protein [Gammaproteobacteria bacterium]